MTSNLMTRIRHVGRLFRQSTAARHERGEVAQQIRLERDSALQQVEELQRSLDAALLKIRQSAIEGELSRRLQTQDFYPERDAEQDRRIGDFRQHIQNAVSKDRPSIEIGPSYNPLIPKRLGFNVRIVDHANDEELKAKYRRESVDVSLIEPVDVIWSEGKLSAQIQERGFSAIVASHMIEHATDFTGFLQDCSELLGADRHLFLIVPDKRFCFDFRHPTTDVAKVISDHRASRKRHSLESLLRNSSNVKARFGETETIVWGQHEIADLNFIDDDPRISLAGAIKCTESGTFFDCHENYFAPSSFALIIEELRYLGYVDLSLRTVTRARDCEFLVILGKNAVKTRTKHEHLQVRKFLCLNMLREEREWLGFMKRLLKLDLP